MSRIIDVVPESVTIERSPQYSPGANGSDRVSKIAKKSSARTSNKKVSVGTKNIHRDINRLLRTGSNIANDPEGFIIGVVLETLFTRK